MGVTYPNNMIRAFLSFFSLYLFNKSKIVRIKKLTAPVKGAVIDFLYGEELVLVWSVCFCHA